MSKIRNWTVGTKIGVGYSIITLVLMVVVLVTIQKIKSMESITKRVAQLRTPTAHASLMMLNGMNHSLASLRGWVILGEEKFKEERASAWKDQIEPSLNKMKELSPNWTDSENINRLNLILAEIESFKKSQEKIESIAQTLENTPARKILLEEAAPLEKIIVNNLSKMIKEEIEAPSSASKKKLLGILADLETSISFSMEKVEEFMLSGKDFFKLHYLRQWEKFTKRFMELKSSQNQFSNSQMVAFKRIDLAQGKLNTLLKKILEIRSGEKWNLANHWLGDEAAPVAFKIKQLLNEMADSQEILLEADVEKVSSQTHYLIVLLVLLLFVGVLVSGVLGSSITRAISNPIRQVSQMAAELASGNYRQKRLPVESDDELGNLNKSFNKLLERLRSNEPSERK